MNSFNETESFMSIFYRKTNLTQLYSLSPEKDHIYCCQHTHTHKWNVDIYSVCARRIKKNYIVLTLDMLKKQKPIRLTFTIIQVVCAGIRCVQYTAYIIKIKRWKKNFQVKQNGLRKSSKIKRKATGKINWYFPFENMVKGTNIIEMYTCQIRRE